MLDATGVYDQPAAVGVGGVPARGERARAARLIRDLGALEQRLETLAGRRVLLVGHGHSAANALALLDGASTPQPRVTWATRSPNRRPVRRGGERSAARAPARRGPRQRPRRRPAALPHRRAARQRRGDRERERRLRRDPDRQPQRRLRRRRRAHRLSARPLVRVGARPRGLAGERGRGAPAPRHQQRHRLPVGAGREARRSRVGRARLLPRRARRATDACPRSCCRPGARSSRRFWARCRRRHELPRRGLARELSRGPAVRVRHALAAGRGHAVQPRVHALLHRLVAPEPQPRDDDPGSGEADTSPKPRRWASASTTSPAASRS